MCPKPGPHSVAPRRSALGRLKRLMLLALGPGLAAAMPGPARAQSGVNVLTYHNDNARTGQNLNESTLTLTNVNVNSFGKLFDCEVDGYVYAQPLCLTGVQVPGKGTHNLVFVATEHDSVYAFDADTHLDETATPLWQVSLIEWGAGETTVPISDFALTDPPEIGITGTPVIDSTSGTLFVVAKVKITTTVPPTYSERLCALDVATGAMKIGPVDIQASIAGFGDGNDGTGHVFFDPFHEFQRTGLLLLNGVVYIAFASQGDIDPYHGWVIGYDAQTLRQVCVFNDTPNGSEGGIWMSGGAPAADSRGYIYLMTGNGTFDAAQGGVDLGDSFLKLSTSASNLVVTDSFTPYNQAWMQSDDADLGSGAPLVLPDSAGNESHAHLLVGAGKNGTIYLLDRDNLGRFNPQADTQIVQELVGVLGQGCFSMPAYFNGSLYYQGFNDVLKAYRIANAQLSATPISQAGSRFGYPGATPSISANGTNDAIVWTLQADAFSDGGPAVLHAYNATNLAVELYDSSLAGTRDQLALAQKFSVPTIANGKVYVGTGGALSVFGNVDSPVITQSPADETVLAGTNLTLTVTASGTLPLAYAWYFNGASIPNADGPTLTLTNIQLANAGMYIVAVSNTVSSVASDPFQLTVLSLPVLSFTATNGLAIQGQAGQNYLVEFTDDLEPTPYWVSLTTLTLTNSIQTVPGSGLTNQAQRFYRAILLPF